MAGEELLQYRRISGQSLRKSSFKLFDFNQKICSKKKDLFCEVNYLKKCLKILKKCLRKWF